VRRSLGFAAITAATVLLSLGGTVAAEYTIVIDKMAFGAVPQTLHPGDTIMWQNNDVLRHTATAKDHSFDLNLPSKSSATMVVGAAGTVAFFCKFHPGMIGKLVITP
jgi:plastocyanin